MREKAACLRAVSAALRREKSDGKCIGEGTKAADGPRMVKVQTIG